MHAADFHGLYAIIPTPATPGAGRWDACATVDLDETARLVSRLIDDGVHGLIALGTTGECATLAAEDYEPFVDCLISTVAGRIPTFVGATALGGHDTFRRLRLLSDQGATGTLLGMPMWQPLTTTMAIEYYAAVSDTFPDLAVMVYANARAFRYTFPTEFWEGVSRRAPTATSAKFSDASALAGNLAASEGKVNFLPIDMWAHRFAAVSPSTTTACWATAAAMGPQPSLAVMEAISAGDTARAEAVAADLAWANETFDDILARPEVFASYNIQLEKLRMQEAGYCVPGPIRPPYDVVPPALAEAARECGRRWTQLCRRYEMSASTPDGPG